MPWWGWILTGLAAATLVSVGFVVYLAALFSKGDNPEGKWWPW